jgi:FkbM family methyltransferase
MAGIDAQFRVRAWEQLSMLDAVAQGRWEPEVIEACLSSVRPGDIVLDVGAYVGLYTVLLAKAVGDQGCVVAFEPHTETYVHLQDNVKLNGLTNVRAIRVALGDRCARASLYLSQNPLHCKLMRPRGTETCFQTVEVLEGDEVVAQERLGVPRAVKIDVEGHEHAVLRGLRRTLSEPACQLVACEVHPTLLPPGIDPSHVMDLLRDLGFSRTRVMRYPKMPEFHVLAYKA